MDQKKKEYGLWWIWILFLIIITSVIFTGTRYVGIWGETVIERKVFENSYQKRASDEDALSTYDSQISILQRRLRKEGLTQEEREEIQAQIDAITILKSSKGN